MRYCGNCSEEIPPETDHFEDGGTVYCTACVKKEMSIVFIYELDGVYIGSDEDEDGAKFIEADEDEFEVDPVEDVPDGQISIFEEAEK